MTGAGQTDQPLCTIAVLVTYQPDLVVLERTLAALAGQVDGLVLVDNGSGKAVQDEISDLLRTGLLAICQIQTLFQPKNQGIGQAQNSGAVLARTILKADFILFCDQDSQPAPDMVAQLHVAFGACLAKGIRLAVVGPNFSEPDRALADILAGGTGPVAESDAVIASGALIPAAALQAIGDFDETLFIDFVDTEWCFRARAAGWSCFVARQARMTHSIGRPGPQIIGRRMALHSPDRMYYQIRNLLLLMRRPAVPRGWLLRQMPRALGRSLFLSLTCAPRLQRAKHVGLGLWHGICGRSGALGA